MVSDGGGFLERDQIHWSQSAIKRSTWGVRYAMIPVWPLRTGLYLAFVLGGAAALIYEVAWLEQFTNLLGSSGITITLILMAFMSGLGLGSWLLGRLGDRLPARRIAIVYGVLEAGIGLYALAIPSILEWCEAAYIAFYRLVEPGDLGFAGIRFALGFIALLGPTTLMGGTLPLMTRYLARQREFLSGAAARFYALNTLGAVLGTAVAGYVLLPVAGIATTTHIAAAINFAVAAAVLCVAMASDGRSFVPATERRDPKPEDANAGRSRTRAILMIGYGLSGAAALIYEIAWTRTLSMTLGTTTYAFTTMLATFLGGLALGSILYTKTRRIGTPLERFVWLQVIVAASGILSIPLLEELPFVYLTISTMGLESWLSIQIVRALMAAAIMLLPTVAMGLMFPNVAALAAAGHAGLAAPVGRIYGANTLGGVAGAALGGLVAVPLLGTQKAIMVAATINLLVAAGAFFALSNRASARSRIALAGSTAVLLVLLTTVEPWAPKVITSGVYLYDDMFNRARETYAEAADDLADIPNVSDRTFWEAAMKQPRLLYYNPGVSATVTVLENTDGVRSLLINGKVDASTGGDMRTQVILGHLPLLFYDGAARDVFVVGMGSGVTAGSVLRHDVRSVVCAEISRAVVRASPFFGAWNNNPLSDPRFRVVTRDARAAMLTETREYDVIISQPSNLWVKGESSLFSLEWYRRVRERLRDGGLFAQWLPAYNISERELRIVMHTLRTVFPQLTVWTSGVPGDVLLVAVKDRPLRIDADALASKLGAPQIRADLERIGIAADDLLAETFVMTANELSQYLYGGNDPTVRLNTEDHLLTEFMAPLRLAEDARVARFVAPGRILGSPESLAKLVESE